MERMKIAMITASGLGIAALVPALAGVTSTASVQEASSGAAETSKFRYVGSKSCKMCHSSVQHKTWTKTKMGQAFDTLKPGNAKEAKVKHNLNPEKDYTQDATCLKCHTTGFGHPGGYVIPDPKDKKAVRRAAKLENVGCESCHGPGSEYNKLFREILQTKRKYKIEELYAAGLQKITKDTCTSCHNEHSPTIDAGAPFDFETMKDKDLHERQEMKQREG
ncbi:MAG: cytochrome c family protein [Planctomycetes bacterium]|nr:cytochrome c family protein [Planctomycetota bacterium]